MKFDLNNNRIILTYNETGFTPFNVFAITGIAEAAKNTSSTQNQIGEKGIGFKSVFGVSDKVLIRSGWFRSNCIGIISRFRCRPMKAMSIAMEHR